MGRLIDICVRRTMFTDGAIDAVLLDHQSEVLETRILNDLHTSLVPPSSVMEYNAISDLWHSVQMILDGSIDVARQSIMDTTKRCTIEREMPAENESMAGRARERAAFHRNSWRVSSLYKQLYLLGSL